VFDFAERASRPRRTARSSATVLIETILAAFEMDEILYELRDYVGRPELRPLGLHLQLASRSSPVAPTSCCRSARLVTMTTHFMRAYSLLLHPAPATGAAPLRWAAWRRRSRSRTIPWPTTAAIAKVRADKEREAGDGHDGTWVAHPGLVPIAHGGLRPR
jgi:malate synthase